MIAFREMVIYNGESRVSDSLDTMKTRLGLLIKRNYKSAEIVIHPNKIDDPEALFLLSKDIKNILQNCHLINYGNLTISARD